MSAASDDCVMAFSGIIGAIGCEQTDTLVWILRQMRRLGPPCLRAFHPSSPSDLMPVLGEDPEPGLVATAKRLNASGAEFLVMPCNTTHLLADQIVAASAVPFLNAVEAASAEVTKNGAKVVGIIGSAVLERRKQYETPMERCGAKVIYPSDQARLPAGIKEAKSIGPTDFTRAVVGGAAAELAVKNANCLLVACTELSLMQNEAKLRSNVPGADAMDVLVSATHDCAKRWTPWDKYSD